MGAQRSPEGQSFQQERREKQDLQKEFHSVLRNSGVAAATEFLLENQDANRKFVERQAEYLMTLRIPTKVAGFQAKIAELLSSFSEKLKESTAQDYLSKFYEEYKELSERQKTLLKGGFKAFVSQRLTVLQAEGEMAPEEQEFFDEVLSKASRVKVNAYLGGVGNEETHGDLTVRINHKLRVEKLGKEIAVIQEETHVFQEKILVLQECLQKLVGLLSNK